MKKYVITIKSESQSIVETGALFDAIQNGTKLHTIHKNYLLWVKKFAEIDKKTACISVRYWSGVPYKSKMYDGCDLDYTSGISVQELFFYWQKTQTERTVVDALGNIYVPSVDLITLAKNECVTIESLRRWFKTLDLREPLAIIQLTNFKY